MQLPIYRRKREQKNMSKDTKGELHQQNPDYSELSRTNNSVSSTDKLQVERDRERG